MTILFGVPIAVSIATSSAMIIITAAAGVFSYYSAGIFNPSLALPLSLAALIGALIGARICVKTDRRIINIIFSVVLLLAAAWMVFKVFW